MSIFRRVLASKATAQKLYVKGKGKPDKKTNIIGPEEFDLLLSADPTPQKKFIQPLCKWVVGNSYSLLEKGGTPNWSLYTVKDYLASDGWSVVVRTKPEDPGKFRESIVDIFSVGKIRYLFQDALELESAHVKLKDPMSFDSLDDYEEYIRGVEKESGKTEKEAMRRWLATIQSVVPKDLITYESDKCVIVRLPDFDVAPKILGKLKPLSDFGDYPHWCVTQEESHWNDYLSDNEWFHLLISKTNRESFMVQRHEFLWGENGDVLPEDEAEEVVQSLGIDLTNKFLPSFDPEKTGAPRTIWLMFLDKEDLDWDGWDISFEGDWLSRDVLRDVFYDLKNEFLSDNGWMNKMDDRAEDDGCDLVVGYWKPGVEENYFLDQLAADWNVPEVDVLKNINFGQVPDSEDYLNRFWSGVLDDLFFTNDAEVNFRISTRWIESEGIRWNPNYDGKDLGRHLKALFRNSRINAEFQILDDTMEVVYEVIPPEHSDSSLLPRFPWKDRSKLEDLLMATVVHNKKDPDEGQENFGTFQTYLIDLILGWVHHQGGRK